jgi:hypothetical protein
MYIQIRKYKLKADFKQVSEQAARELGPQMKKIRGFVDYMIVDSHDGNILSVSIFQDKSGAFDARDLALQWHRQNSAAALDGPLEIIEGDVVSQAAEQPSGPTAQTAA